MKLSVALAIFNEETVITRCLDSVYEMADEVVIVDGGSTDKTLEIIKKYDKDEKIHVLHEGNPPMFHINKQKAIEKCKGEWILQMDADEVVSSELRHEIEDVVERNPVENGFWIPRLNFFLGKPLRKGGQYPDPTVRLYRNGKARLACKSIHEQADVEGQIGLLKHDLLHYPWPTFGDYVDKALARYSKLEAEDLYKRGVRPNATNFIKYMIIYPKIWFLKTYFRHKGFMDGFPGFVFSLFSSLRYWVEYVALYEKSH